MTILEIFIFKGEQLLGSRVYTDAMVTIGRSSANLLPLDDRQISRHHATISVDGKRMLIRDESSQLGTLVNGVAVKEQTFRESDTISIGTFRLKVARRSMGQALDFDEDEPTEAGQRALRLERHGELTPSPGSVQAYNPPLQPSPTPPSSPVVRPSSLQRPSPTPPSSPALRPAAAPPSPPLQRPSPTPPSSPALQARTPASSPRAPQPIPDSDSSEIRAGLEDSVPIDISLRDEVPQASSAVEAGGPPVSQALPVIQDPAAQEFALDPRTTPRARTVPAAEPPQQEQPTRMLPPQEPPQQEPPLSASARTQPPVVSGLPGEDQRPAGGPALSPDRFAHPDEYEDDEEDDDFVPSFSLLERLSEEPMRPTSPTPPQLEIIHHRDGRVIDLLQVSAGGSFPASGPRLVQLDRSGRAQLSVTDELTGHVFLNGKPIPLEEIRRGARDRKGVSVLELREGDRAEVIASRQAPAGAPPLRDHYHIRFIRPLRPQATAIRMRQVVRPLGNKYLVGALFLHVLLLVGLSRIPSEPPAPAEEPRFAEVSMKAIAIEPPPEPPKVKEPDPAPTPPEIKPALTKVRPVKVQPRLVQRTAPRPPQNALAALEMLKPADPSPSSLKDVVSNINAVSVPADARSRFKVGGAIGKLPVGEVRVSTAGAAHDSTTSGRELLSKGGVGDLKGAGGSGNVRGVVKQPPPAALQFNGSGRLSRAQIQAVINEHVGQVQACYEKNLMRDHSLAGKITFDWVISPTGSVSSARVRSSTMAGSAVSTCILQEIRGWSFPTPEGGAVAVTYPFIFNAQGY